MLLQNNIKVPLILQCNQAGKSPAKQRLLAIIFILGYSGSKNYRLTTNMGVYVAEI
jgi:hypothetical protein